MKYYLILISIIISQLVFAQKPDVYPKYPGGMTAVAKYVSQNINYPADLKEDGIEGLVVIEFTVDTSGAVTKTKVLRSAHPKLDREALRLVSEMPKWEAGLKDGKKTPVKQKLPINFKLSEEERKAVDQKLIEAAGQ